MDVRFRRSSVSAYKRVLSMQQTLWLPCVCCTDVRSGHCLGIGAHVRDIRASLTALFSGCVLHCAVAYSGARLPALSR